MSKISRKELFGGGSDSEGEVGNSSYAGYENLFAFEEVEVENDDTDSDQEMTVVEVSEAVEGDDGSESEEAPEFTFNLFSGAPETVVVKDVKPVFEGFVDEGTASIGRAKEKFNDEYAAAARNKFRPLAYYFTFAEPEPKKQDLVAQFRDMAVDADSVLKVGGYHRYDVPSKVLDVSAHNAEVEKSERRARPGKKRRQKMREGKVHKSDDFGTREYGASRQYGGGVFEYGGSGINMFPLGQRGGFRGGRGGGRGRGGVRGRGGRGRGRGN
ncbi:hypothetical protein B0I72DRAFT_141460 [Yarrowia lipolytica]|jgi:hypothetical protein|uniref:YALI0F05302p n=2 Tax=Yarrowia lipolytica TaxID=4952 RepID=Q6C2T5_YARLI|nr:YALI0F05302p [Yarrowia lipolytica CLIB122]AOW06695.1 hypothetical protein YALI1_F07907g [Yarrowia lipolytica]KAB8284802.1 hypothetical protein BKA91DRAFT_134398 [Yarrowia lipolytica]KAE8174783.1 hypothetical protein BKA90DRAFT_133450 [Yarrowia lipolytica]KAJ8056089.1 hypothetical protein LXG23DRAFT_57620 [Yarrowia lipolytica]QNQ01341.1 Hypothetical protein YALI2_F00886g [Yarrowia lipolytica]|eukprot:XP_505027.1 YALI0F05302p [Yarrowia lipolytica CLIB122]